MLVDRKGAFRAELVTEKGSAGYDTPRCALSGLRSSGSATAKLRVQEFYTRAYVDGDTVRYVAGSDIEGPMGGELVPVAPDKVEKFKSDHHGSRVYRLEEITTDVLKKEGAP